MLMILWSVLCFGNKNDHPSYQNSLDISAYKRKSDHSNKILGFCVCFLKKVNKSVAKID